MHEKVLPKGSRSVLDRLEATQTSGLDGWILAGGTGLALHLGHRVSNDFDFFRTDETDVRSLHAVLKQCGTYETLQEAEHTLTVLVEGVKLSFFRTPDPFLHEPEPYRFFLVADPLDIALMKLVAISGRGSRKDFVDLYTILRNGPDLSDLFTELPTKYGERANLYHILKSITYFEDAEQEPMPVMLEPFDWSECKAFLVRQAHMIVLG